MIHLTLETFYLLPEEKSEMERSPFLELISSISVNNYQFAYQFWWHEQVSKFRGPTDFRDLRGKPMCVYSEAESITFTGTLAAILSTIA